jgi:hypothetical protein
MTASADDIATPNRNSLKHGHDTGGESGCPRGLIMLGPIRNGEFDVISR